MRLRSLGTLLSRELFGASIALPDFPLMKGICGIGMSDPPLLASRVAEKLAYTNTFYHQPPKLDITAPDPDEFGKYDFIISSEVMEHVPQPVEPAFANLCRLLKPDGFLLLTVPYRIDGGVTEHFPELHEYSLTQVGGRTVLVNRRKDGTLEVFENLCFHGGDGSTLEMRVFSEESLKAVLAGAGFAEVHIACENEPEFGIEHAETWSLPVVARKGRRQALAPEIAKAYSEACRKQAVLEREFAILRDAYERHIAFHKSSHAEMERQMAERAEWVKKVEADFAERTQWALQLNEEKQDLEAELLRVRGSEAEAWQKAAGIERELGDLRAERTRVEGRLWTRLGRRLGLVR